MDDIYLHRIAKAQEHFEELREVMQGFESVAVIEALTEPFLWALFMLCATYLIGKWLGR